MSAPWKHVWITGASSGLGENCARKLAEQGCHVSISARSEDKLNAIADGNSNISVYPCDVTDREKMNAVKDEMEAAHGPVDLVILCAGAWFQSSLTEMKPENFQKTLDVNIMGVVNGLDAVLPDMIARGEGHISWVSSVAGYGGLPNSASYGATKAALINMAEGSHGELARKGIALSVINPGFVRTPMTDKNDFPMPFLMEPEDAADKMIAGLKAKKFEIAFPWQLVWILKFLNILPYWLYLRIIQKIA
ncbi:SDR family NAD(P)-dependent oxidoreductase [Ahrensia sp. R2A130]|uniref:SDR family NAD(P)-dependent oxidoreductase n=1 Tax=Ahrensia sp. R2A130 TaxID=744979 RepID=UPI0001E0D0CE|nr:SDR family NAD(P)-dependent oxidoreductase [Ahrensia sp. R2A130]EFL90879.1 oxidoreductase, short chain dehydrogenase [Ahrensia sp. R2A130]